MRRFLLSAALAATVAVVPWAGVSAHKGGHQGGCEEFGHINHDIARDPAAFGFVGYNNLGEIVSDFATDPAPPPGVGWIVETIDHLACG
jgi:hypothetical protein